ncbi:MAG: hypothetical protein EPN21_13005, partial [Methylococcaceae bacterium]
ESDAVAVITVKLSQAAPDFLYVDYKTQAVTATAGDDYTESSGSLEFAPGETEHAVLIALLSNTRVEPNETFRFLLGNPRAFDAGLAVALGAPASATVTIQNDDLPTLSVKDISVTEGNSGNGNAQFTLTLDQVSAIPLSVDYATRDGTAGAGSDYTAARGTLSFAIGQKTQTVSIPILGDATLETDETFSLDLSNPGTGLALAQTSATATIIDDDAQAPTLTIAASQTTFKAGDSATLTFTFSAAPLDFSAADITVSGGTLSGLAVSSANPKVYSAGFTPTADADNLTGSILVTAGQFTDAAGNAGMASNVLDTQGDTRVPIAPTLALTTDSGSSAGDGITQSGTIAVDGLESGATWQYSNGNGSWKAGTGSSFTLTGQGAHTVLVRQSDAAGNQSANSTALTFTLDNVLPAAPTLTLTSDSGSGSSAGDGITQSGVLSVSGLESGATWQYNNGNGSWKPGTGSSFTLTGQGAHTVLVRQSDAAGNQSPNSTALTFTLDSVSPAVTISSDKTSFKTGDTATVTFSFSEIPAGFAGNDVTVTGGSLGALTADAGGKIYTATFTPTANSNSLSGAIAVAAATYTDTAGNNGAAGNTLSLTGDTQAPVFSSGTTVTVAENTASGTTIYDAAADGDAGVTYGLTGADAAKFTIDATNGTVSLAFLPDFEAPADNGANNVYDFSVRATDTAGNFTEQAVAMTVTDVLETGQPVIDLGTAYGKLILPVYVDGNWYYYWDRSGDGSYADTQGAGYTNTADYTTHDDLDGLFTQDINGATGGAGNTNNTYRYTSLNGIQVALPTQGDTILTTGFRLGTTVGGSPVSAGSTLTNPTYDDLLAIWDAYNGTGTGTNSYGTPLDWYDHHDYWSATPSASGHAHVYLNFGNVYDNFDYGNGYVALQVLSVDATAPTVSTIAITSATGLQNSTLNAGDMVSVTVTLSEATTVTGTPQLALTIGGTTVQAGYASGSGSTALVFQYAIQANQTDANGIGIPANALALNGGALKDAAGNNATLSHALVADNAGYRVDATAPVFTSAATATVAENTASGTTIYDAAADGDTGVTYGISGADAAKFTMDLSNGTVSLAFLPDFEVPADSGANNVYDFSVRATDTAGNFTDQAVAMTVTDVAEAGQPVIELGAAYGKLILP